MSEKDILQHRYGDPQVPDGKPGSVMDFFRNYFSERGYQMRGIFPANNSKVQDQEAVIFYAPLQLHRFSVQSVQIEIPQRPFKERDYYRLSKCLDDVLLQRGHITTEKLLSIKGEKAQSQSF